MIQLLQDSQKELLKIFTIHFWGIFEDFSGGHTETRETEYFYMCGLSEKKFWRISEGFPEGYPTATSRELLEATSGGIPQKNSWRKRSKKSASNSKGEEVFKFNVPERTSAAHKY